MTQRIFRQSNTAILYISSNKLCSLINLDDLKVFNPDQLTSDFIEYTEFNWVVTLGVFVLESNGKEKAIYQEAASPIQCKHHQLTNSLYHTHLDLINSLPEMTQDRIVSVGWIATPYERELPVELVDKIFSKNGAFIQTE